MSRSNTPQKLFDAADVRAELDFLGVSSQGECWLQVFKPRRSGQPQRGVLHSEFCTKEKAVRLAEEFNGRGLVCVAVNNYRVKGGTQAEDVKEVSALFIDVDVRKTRRKGFVSTPEDHAHALRKAQEEIRPYLEGKGFTVGLIVDSGNGVQLFVRVKLDVSTPEEREAFLSKVKFLEQDLRHFNDDIVEVDFITKDLNRRVKLAGTLNMKDEAQAENRLSRIIYRDPHISVEKNNAAFNSLPLPKEKPSPPVMSGVRVSDERLNRILSSDSSVKALFEGKWQRKYKSRSEAEFALLMKLMRRGLTDYGQLDEIMRKSAIGKWRSAPESYRRLTYEKVREHYEEDAEYLTRRFDDDEQENFLGISRFMKSTTVFIPKDGEIYTHLREVEKGQGHSYFESIFSLYEGKVGAGNKPLIIKTKERLNPGDNSLYLLSMSEDEISRTLWHMKNEGFSSLCKLLSVNTTDKHGAYIGKEKIINDYLMNLSSNFKKITIPINTDELKKLGNPLRAVRQILRNGLRKSEELDYFFASAIPEINPSLIEPQDFMRFAPHTLAITNPKTGKTFNATMIAGEPPVERPTEAGLLGFADGKDKHIGKLHERTKTTCIDEVQEEKGQELFGKLHSFMEVGKGEIVRGVRITLETYSTLFFLGNPKLVDEREGEASLTGYLTMRMFRDFLTKISYNVQPFGSRIALVIFDTNLETVSGTPSNLDIMDKGLKIIRSLAEAYRDEFSQLFKEEKVLRYLNEPFPDTYRRAVKRIIKGCSDRVINEFLAGQLEAYRHARGMALRLAWLDKGLSALWGAGSVDIDELIKASETHFVEITKRNLKSYQNILNLLHSEVYAEIMRYNLKNIQPEYVKLAFYAVCEWKLSHPDNKDKIVPLTSTGGYYDAVREYCQIGRNETYRSFSRITRSFENFTDSSPLRDFGLDYDNSIQSFLIIDDSTFSRFVREYDLLKKERSSDNKESGSSPSPAKPTEEVVNILSVIAAHDSGDGLSFDVLLRLSGWSDADLEKELKRLVRLGEVYEPKPDHWRVLK